MLTTISLFKSGVQSTDYYYHHQYLVTYVFRQVKLKVAMSNKFTQTHLCSICTNWYISVKPFIILTDLEFKLFDSLGHTQGFLLESGLVSFQVAELLLESLGLSLLVAIVSSYFFDDSVQLVRQCFSRVLAFHGKHGLKGLLFGSQNLNFFLVNIQILCELSNYLIQVPQFSLQVSSIVLSSSCWIHTND